MIQMMKMKMIHFEFEIRYHCGSLRRRKPPQEKKATSGDRADMIDYPSVLFIFSGIFLKQVRYVTVFVVYV